MNLQRAFLYFLAFWLPGVCGMAQEFNRSRLMVDLDTPWEIVYGPDDHLWISEKGGKVVRVEPETGVSTVVFTAQDYFAGAQSEKAPCGLSIGANTYGLALHPDFSDPEHSFLYLVYSYNSGTEDAPATLFKIARLTWDAKSNSVVAHEDLKTGLANGFDHFGGRLIAVRQDGKDYLYYSTGDTGANIEGCYDTPADNPNLTAQDPFTQVGKIHRINIDGSIPADNPIAGNTFYTRGHRNPQGLAYNPGADVLYAIEHGHTTDDEINILEAGMNYGWKDVKGYHDGNYPDELAYVENYTPHPDVPGDMLKEPLYSWGAVSEPDGGYLSWPTVAPSDGTYYGSGAIPEWTNSLLVVTLKNGDDTYQEIFQFKLTPDGISLAPSTPDDPNPKTYFRDDQIFNGRLRDIAVSPDGRRLYVITNNRNVNNPIIVYTYQETTSVRDLADAPFTLAQNAPNPFSTHTVIRTHLKRAGRVKIEISNALGQQVKTLTDARLPAGEHTVTWNGRNEAGQQLPNGLYLYTMSLNQAQITRRMLLGN